MFKYIQMVTELACQRFTAATGFDPIFTTVEFKEMLSILSDRYVIFQLKEEESLARMLNAFKDLERALLFIDNQGKQTVDIKNDLLSMIDLLMQMPTEFAARLGAKYLVAQTTLDNGYIAYKASYEALAAKFLNTIKACDNATELFGIVRIGEIESLSFNLCSQVANLRRILEKKSLLNSPSSLYRVPSEVGSELSSIKPKQD